MGAKEYEELVADVSGRLVKTVEATVHKDRSLVGRSGQKHQIDIVVELEILAVKVLILIECKWWNQRVGLEEVMVLAGRLDDVGAHKGMIVTTTGFEKGAYRLARSKGIALVLCKDRIDGSGPDCVPFTVAAPSLGRMGDPPRYSYFRMQGDSAAKEEGLQQMISGLVND